MKLKIGNVEIANPCVLAPMAGVTDLPFRLLCKEQGVGLLSMEMVSAKAISFHNKNTLDRRGRKSDRSADLRFRSGDHGTVRRRD